MLKEERDRKQATQESEFEITRLRLIAESVSKYFTERRVANLFVVKVLEKLAKSQHCSQMDKSLTLGYLTEIVKRCPSWLSVHDNSEGRILRLNKSLALNDIYRMLE